MIIVIIIILAVVILGFAGYKIMNNSEKDNDDIYPHF